MGSLESHGDGKFLLPPPGLARPLAAVSVELILILILIFNQFRSGGDDQRKWGAFFFKRLQVLQKHSFIAVHNLRPHVMSTL